jgi:hypothetical protein
MVERQQLADCCPTRSAETDPKQLFASTRYDWLLQTLFGRSRVAADATIPSAI